MTFEYRDAYGRVLTVAHGVDDDDNPVAVLWARGEYSTHVPVRIPADRVEEVVAGIRDAARTATTDKASDTAQHPTAFEEALNGHTAPKAASNGAARQAPAAPAATGVPCGQCHQPWTDGHGYHAGDRCTPGSRQPDPAVVDEFIRDMADRHVCGNCDGIDPDSCLANPGRTPAVGQPAEAHDTDRTRVRWGVESSYPNGGTCSLPAVDDRTSAEKYLAAARESSPEATHRLVRETTTWTVEDAR